MTIKANNIRNGISRKYSSWKSLLRRSLFLSVDEVDIASWGKLSFLGWGFRSRHWFKLHGLAVKAGINNVPSAYTEFLRDKILSYLKKRKYVTFKGKFHHVTLFISFSCRSSDKLSFGMYPYFISEYLVLYSLVDEL